MEAKGKRTDNSGHRQRVKDAVKQNGFNHLTDERFLELILFYSVPRVDVYDLAKNLVQEFGSLQNVFCADFDRLCKVKGVGENTALMLSAMGEALKRTSKPNIDKRVSLKSVDDLKALAKSELYGLNNENVILVCLDNAKRVKKIVHISEGDKREAFIDVRKAVQVAIDCEASAAFIAHNHPEDSCEPSANDVDSTRALCVMFRKLGFLLVDHIIIGCDNEAYSMRSDPLFSQMFY
jgi:DNA repair protein RadC